MYTVIFKIIGGDVFEVPTTGHSCYPNALFFVLDWFGFKRNDVIVCVTQEWSK